MVYLPLFAYIRFFDNEHKFDIEFISNYATPNDINQITQADIGKVFLFQLQ